MLLLTHVKYKQPGMNFMTVYKSLSSTLILKQYIVIASNLKSMLKKIGRLCCFRRSKL